MVVGREVIVEREPEETQEEETEVSYLIVNEELLKI